MAVSTAINPGLAGIETRVSSWSPRAGAPSRAVPQALEGVRYGLRAEMLAGPRMRVADDVIGA